MPWAGASAPAVIAAMLGCQDAPDRPVHVHQPEAQILQRLLAELGNV
jgi:hypothetical protein